MCIGTTFTNKWYDIYKHINNIIVQINIKIYLLLLFITYESIFSLYFEYNIQNGKQRIVSYQQLSSFKSIKGTQNNKVRNILKDNFVLSHLLYLNDTINKRYKINISNIYRLLLPIDSHQIKENIM